MLKYLDLIGLNQINNFTYIFLPFVLWLLEKLKWRIVILLLNSAILEHLVQTREKCEFI